MRLNYQMAPRAGDYFNLYITECVGMARVDWFIDGNLVNVTECDDPPCYEQMYLPPHLDGSELRIVGADDVDTRELRFRISGTDLAPTTAMEA